MGDNIVNSRIKRSIASTVLVHVFFTGFYLNVDNRAETKEFTICSNWTIPPPWII